MTTALFESHDLSDLHESAWAKLAGHLPEMDDASLESVAAGRAKLPQALKPISLDLGAATTEPDNTPAGIRFEVQIPYEGSEILLELRPTAVPAEAVNGSIQTASGGLRGHISIVSDWPRDVSPEDVKKWRSDWARLLGEWVKSVNSDAERFNRALTEKAMSLATTVLADRQQAESLGDQIGRTGI